MKKFYEAPVAEELVIATQDVMLMSTGSDESKDDLNWDLM